jgi:hypothetical protein
MKYLFVIIFLFFSCTKTQLTSNNIEATKMDALQIHSFERLCIDGVVYLSWLTSHGYRNITAAFGRDSKVIVCSLEKK